MATTTINKKLKPQVRKAIEQVPEKEIESWLKWKHPEFFAEKKRIENKEAREALEELMNFEPVKPKNDPLPEDIDSYSPSVQKLIRGGREKTSVDVVAIIRHDRENH